MPFDTTTALGAMTGARYIESLKDGREVWLDGEKVQDVTTHPAFTGMVHELARIYDLQHTETYRDQMTFVSPMTGHRCSLSWLLPQSHEDLQQKRRNSEIWNEQCWGQLGRGPDILAPYIITLYDLRETLSTMQHPRCDFGANVVNYYHYCLENDLFLTHALGDPQVDRSQQPQNEPRDAREEELVFMWSKRPARASSYTAPSNWPLPRPSATRPMSRCPQRSYDARIRPACWPFPSPPIPLA